MARRHTVLIVDDAPENLNVLADLLQPKYRVLAARSGTQALSVANAKPTPDLILLDVQMPDVDGYAVLKALQSQLGTREIPVIFVTCLHGAEDEEYGLALGAADYISKPIKPNLVLARVQTQLDVKRARDVLRGQNAQLELEITRRMAETLHVQEVTIRALARLAEIRDNETGNHLLRTQAYVRVLATQLRSHPLYAAILTEESIAVMAKSAPLHDIGKVGIPDHILLKPGPLTADERAVMERHAILGAQAIEQAERDAEHPLEFLRIAKEIARHHHERWDGTGYPDALAGTAIPLAARLMAVADVFDALISRRPYKEPMSLEAAAKLVRAGRGSQFDSHVVEAFDAQLPEMFRIAQHYRDGGPPVPLQESAALRPPRCHDPQRPPTQGFQRGTAGRAGAKCWTSLADGSAVWSVRGALGRRGGGAGVHRR